MQVGIASAPAVLRWGRNTRVVRHATCGHSGMRRAMRVDWGQFDDLGADRLWLRPLGLISGHAAAAAIAAGYARPLIRPNLAFTAIAAIGLGPERRPLSVTAPLA